VVATADLHRRDYFKPDFFNGIEQNRALRGRLIKIAREYEGLAKELAPRRD
jgi:hypothetical protein